MAKYHLKRLAAPVTWQIERKSTKFITKPSAGPHSLKYSMPLSVILKDILHYATTTKEVKKILQKKNMLVNGVRRKEHRFPVGLFDVIEIKETNEFFRIIFNKKGKLELIKISKEEAGVKPYKIVNKTMRGKKLQLNLFDGKNILVEDAKYKTNDTVVLQFPNEIKKHLKLDKNASIYITGGKHTGEIGKIEKVIDNAVIYKNKNNELIQTFKKNVFIIGEDSPIIKISEKVAV